MEILLATIAERTSWKHAAASQMFVRYRERIEHYTACQAEEFPTEEKFMKTVQRGAHGRTPPKLVLLDSLGKLWSSEAFAAWLSRQRDEGTRKLVFAIGPADGWSARARQKSDLLLSLGPMTLPHELAAVVLAEQLYRAFTIIQGHPYHLGHRE